MNGQYRCPKCLTGDVIAANRNRPLSKMKLEEYFSGFTTETPVPELSGDIELDQLEAGLVGNAMDKREANEVIAVNDDVRVTGWISPVCVQIRIGKTW